MTNRFLRKTGIMLSMLSVQQLCPAQNISLASQFVRLGPATAGESPRARSKNLKDLLIDLGRQHQVSILFEEQTVKNITITGQEYRRDDNKLEKQLTDLLKPFNLKYKKAGKDAYVIISRFEKKISEWLVS